MGVLSLRGAVSGAPLGLRQKFTRSGLLELNPPWVYLAPFFEFLTLGGAIFTPVCGISIPPPSTSTYLTAPPGTGSPVTHQRVLLTPLFGTI